MYWNEHGWELAFSFSAAINVSVALYFGLFRFAKFSVKKCFGRDNRLAKAHKKSPNFMHCFYFDTIVFTCIVLDAFILTFTTFPLQSPFTGHIPLVDIYFLTAVCGVRVFLLCRDLSLLRSTRTKIAKTVVHVVFLIVLGNVIVLGECGIMAIMLITCEGDVIIINVGTLLRQLGYKGTSCYRVTMFVGCYASIAFRAIVPLGLLFVSIVNGQPFQMQHHSMVIFFVGLVVYGIVNTWQVNSSVSRICKKKPRVIEVPYAHFVQEVDDSLKDEENEIPPSYQEACHPDLAVVSAPVAAAGSDNQAIEIERMQDYRGTQAAEAESRPSTDISGIILQGLDEGPPHYPSTISDV